MDCNSGEEADWLAQHGDILAKAKYDEEDFVICEVDYRDLRTAETFIPTLRDLRPELFDKLKEYSEQLLEHH